MSSGFAIPPSGFPSSNANGTVPDVAIEQNALIPALPPLSDELIVKILGYLNPRELATCGLVCKHLNIVSAESSLWRSLFQRSFGPHGNLENNDFLKAYKDQHRIASNFTNGVYASHYLSDAGMCKSFALSVRGKRLISSSGDNTIKIWDRETDTCLRTLAGHTGSVRSLALSADGKRLVSSSGDNTIKVWDPETGACLHTLTGHGEKFSSLALSADGKRLYSASDDNTIKAWDLETGTCLHTLTGHTSTISYLILSTDGKRLYSASDDNTIKAWDLETGTCLHTLTGHTNTISYLILSADGRQLISSSFDNTIKIWDLEKGVCLHTLIAHGRYVTSLALSVDSRRLFSCASYSTDSDCKIRVWDFDAKHHAIFKEIAGLFGKGNPKAVKEAMDRFSRMPKNERGKVYAELYDILKPFTNDYWGCAEHAFHDQHGQCSTPEQKAQAIHHAIFKEIADLFRKGDPDAVKEAMDRFSGMPEDARSKVYAELYKILKPFTNDYWGCAEHAFHDQKGLHPTLAQKVQAIENCFVRRS